MYGYYRLSVRLSPYKLSVLNEVEQREILISVTSPPLTCQIFSLYGGILYGQEEEFPIFTILYTLLIAFFVFRFLSLWICVLMGQSTKYRIIKAFLPIFRWISGYNENAPQMQNNPRDHSMGKATMPNIIRRAWLPFRRGETIS